MLPGTRCGVSSQLSEGPCTKQSAASRENSGELIMPMPKLRLLIFVCLSMSLVVPAFAQNIITVAGGGPNNVPAVSAALEPFFVAFDASGNYYIGTLAQILRVDKNGQVDVYAGSGSASGFSGDGGLATSALTCPQGGLTIDNAGNLFFGDCTGRIRRIDGVTHLITTVAGNGTYGFSGDGGPATAATLGTPTGVAVDSVGNLFIADNNARIRRVDAGTQVITTVPVPGLVRPHGIAIDSAGKLYVTDLAGHRVYRVDVATQVATVVAGNGTDGFSGDGGPATAAQMNAPLGVAVDSAGNLFISDLSDRIRRVDSATQVITTVAGNGTYGFSGDGGPATAAQMNAPLGMAVDSVGDLFIADNGNFRTRRVDATTQLITTVAGNGTYSFSGDGGPATSAQFSAAGVVVDSAGNLFVSDIDNCRIRRVDATTQVINTIAGDGQCRSGGVGDGGPARAAALYYPVGLALDKAGNLFIGVLDDRVRRVDAATQTITTVAGNGTEGFSGDGGPATSAQLSVLDIAIDNAENLFITDWEFNRIRRVDAATQTITTYAGNGTMGFSGDGGPATAAQLSPAGVAVDTVGNLFIADRSNCRIRRVDATTQVISTIAGDGQCGFSGDGGPATSAELSASGPDAVDTVGNLFIADGTNCRIRRVDATTQVISTVAGDGQCGFSGDGGPATSAELRPGGPIAVDSAGNLFISDGEGGRIREVLASKQNQTISFAAIANRTFLPGDSFTVSATASSGLGVTFTVGTGDSCTIFGTTVQVTGVGSCTVKGQQVGNDSYNAAPDVAESFRILYAAAGQACYTDVGHTILPPIKTDGTSVWKQGRTVPAKFRVCDGAGNSVGTPGVVASFHLIEINSGTSSTNVNETVSSTTPDTQFHWDPTDQQWIFNTSTSGLAAGNTYVYQILLNDGTAIMFQFGLQ